MALAPEACLRFGGKYGMEARHRDKRPETKEPLEGTLDYDLYVSNLYQEIIELREVAEEGPLLGKDRISSARRPVGLPEQGRLLREKPDLERKGRKHRPEPTRGAIPPTVSWKGENGPAQKPQPESRTSTGEAFPAATENCKPVARHQEMENLEADQIFAEFFASLDPSDLSEETTETGCPSHRPIVKKRSRVEDDALEKLLGELESTEPAVVKETSNSRPPVGEPVVTGGLREAESGWSDTRCSQRLLALDKEIARCQEEVARRMSQLQV